MPLYFFHMRNSDTIADTDGTELADHTAAQTHARGVARELMYRNDGMLGRDWSSWCMAVHDEGGEELFSFPFSDLRNDES